MTARKPPTPFPSTEVRPIVEPRPELTPFLGRWRITSMEGWDADYFDMEVPALFFFDDNGMGHFQFGLVQGGIDCRVCQRDGQATIEFSWEGQDECDPALGRGWASIEESGALAGRIFIHCGDDSAFSAIKEDLPKKTAGRRAARPARAPRRRR